MRLTQRETQVLTLIAEGLTSQETADKMAIGRRGVDFHLSNVYRKLDVKNRIMAHRRAVELGIIPTIEAKP